MASISAAQLTSNIRGHIHHALFGTRGPGRDMACDRDHRLDDIHQLSQEFSLASPMGGGGMPGGDAPAGGDATGEIIPVGMLMAGLILRPAGTGKPGGISQAGQSFPGRRAA